MLASITPLGERGRQAHWSITVSAFLLGATGAGAVAGALAGAAGAYVLPRSLGAATRLGVLAVAVLAAIALDLRSRPVPGPRRQVDERWLDEFRGWVYGLGYGAQLGVGVTTIVTSAATYAALLAAAVSGSAARGAVIVGCYGAVRGLTPLGAVGVRSPHQLLGLHRWLARWREPAARGAVLVLAAIALAAVTGSLT
jgi:hypothetical protein